VKVRFAAVYTHGLVKNHPFLDGNKRTGFVAGITFLKINRHPIEVGERGSGTSSDLRQASFLVRSGRRSSPKPWVATRS